MITFYWHLWGPLGRGQKKFEAQISDFPHAWFFDFGIDKYYQVLSITFGPVKIMLQTSAPS